MARRLHEIPPTAGLPLQLTDLLPRADSLSAQLTMQLNTPTMQLECSGTAALLVALLTLRKQKPRRDAIIVPAYTCPLIALAVRHLGLELRICDTRANHWEMDPQVLARLCDERTLAIIPTHLAGLVADLEIPLTLARECGAFVIEDAAQALGARDTGLSVGLRGDVGFFSLAAGKGLSIYEGGLLLSQHESLRAALQESSDSLVPAAHAREWRRSLELLGLALLYRPRGLWLAYGMPLRRALERGDPVTAIGDRFPDTIPFHRVGRWRRGVGSRAARRLPAFLAANRDRALDRIGRLCTLPGITVFEEREGTIGSWPYLLLTLPTTRQTEAVLSRLWTMGLGVSRPFIHALPDYDYLAGRVPISPVPHASDLAARALSISNSHWLDDTSFEHILQVLARELD